MDDRNVWKNRLDYETSGSITLVVRVTDADGAHSGPEGNMGEAFQHKDYDARITIILENSNERPIYYGTVRSVDENSGTWTPVGAPVPAIDEDESDTLTYWVDESMGMSVYGGDWLSTNSFFNDMKCFDIHPLYAQIIVANPILDYEIHGAIRIVVRAEDNSGFSDSAYVTITINNVNEGPRWIGGERGYSEEKCPAGWQLLDTTTCCEQSTGCTVFCAINAADAITPFLKSGTVRPDCRNYAESTTVIERPAGPEIRRGCSFYEDGTVDGACRVKADPVDHPNIAKDRRCNMEDNKWCGSTTFAKNSFGQTLETRDAPNAGACSAWCRAQAFPYGAGCSYTKANGMCGIVRDCNSLETSTTHSAAQCEMGNALQLTYKVLGGDPGRIFTLNSQTGVFTVRLPMFLDFENIKEYE
jgi:hypothetical protein